MSDQCMCSGAEYVNSKCTCCGNYFSRETPADLSNWGEDEKPPQAEGKPDLRLIRTMREEGK